MFLPGESHRQRSLGGYSPQGHRVGHDPATKQQQAYNAILLVSDFLSTGPSITKNGVLKSPAATSPYSYFLMCSHAP